MPPVVVKINEVKKAPSHELGRHNPYSSASCNVNTQMVSIYCGSSVHLGEKPLDQKGTKTMSMDVNSGVILSASWIQ